VVGGGVVGGGVVGGGVVGGGVVGGGVGGTVVGGTVVGGGATTTVTVAGAETRPSSSVTVYENMAVPAGPT
jgi:hypothetical protein